MNWISRLLSSEQPPSESSSAHHPLGLRLHGVVRIDPLPFEFAQGKLICTAPVGDQSIDAIGRVDLGGGSELQRFYLADDAFVQVKTTHGDVDEIKLFSFFETKNPANQQAFRKWVEPGSLLGAQTLTIEGYLFQRAWGETPESVWVPPVVFDEKVFAKQPLTSDYDLTHYAMLYQREIPELDRLEYLLVSAEDYGPDEFCVTFSVGVDITSADLMVV